MTDSKKIQKLDLNLLRVFQVLYMEQNMTRAAEVLHITPSAVSHSVRRLRDTLDDPLFRRSQNKMLPTPACQRMAPAIIESLTQLQQLLQQWGEFEPQTSEHNFRIGMHDALELSVIPKLATKLASIAPQVRFSSVKVERANLSKDLASGYLDIALDIPLAIRQPVNFKKLIENKFVVMMRVGHPLANKLTRKNYLAATHMNVSNRPSGMTAEDSQFQELGLVRQTTIRCQNYFAAKEVLKNSNHLLTLPKILAEQFTEKDLIILEMPFKIPGFSTHLYWHENSEQDSALVWIRKVVSGLFSQQY